MLTCDHLIGFESNDCVSIKPSFPNLVELTYLSEGIKPKYTFEYCAYCGIRNFN